MFEKVILSYAKSMGRPDVLETLKNNYEVIKSDPTVSTEYLQSLFTENKRAIKELLKADTQLEHDMVVACLIDETIDYMNIMGYAKEAQYLQNVYEETFGGLVAKRMWELARDFGKTNTTNTR